MTKEEMLLLSRVEALQELVRAMEKTIQAQKETISALEKRIANLPVAQKEIVYVPAPQQTQPYVPDTNPNVVPMQPYIGDPVPYKWSTTSGGMVGIQNGVTVTNTSNSGVENSVGKAKPFLSAFTVNSLYESSRGWK